VGAKFHLPHGLTNAVLLPYVMEYNADPQPTRMGVYPSYTKPQSLQRYACIAKELGLTGNTDSELAAAFADRFMSLSAELGVPNNFKALGVDEAKFLSYIHEIACDAFDDQCSPANPRFPLIVELEELLKKSYYGGALKF
jgi:acetaldehyde dehydrogenase/alcohol dehydrogenase